MSNQNDMMSFATQSERGVARRLVAALLRDGMKVSVHDGEAWAIKRSSSSREIVDALCSTGQDILRAYNPDGSVAADFVLIWGNEPDGSELISDGSGDQFDKYLDELGVW